MLELVSSHIPKCAGVSLRKALTKCFGRQRIFFDYSDKMDDPESLFNQNQKHYWETIQNSKFEELAGKKVVHGHFHVKKYQSFSNAFRLTFLRHPLDRLISHYCYWMHTRPDGTNSLHTYVQEKQLLIEEFAQIPIFRFYYTRKYFNGIKSSDFDFIGFYENFDADLARLGAILGIELPVFWENKTPKRTRFHSISNEKKSLLLDLLIEDVRFYDQTRSSV